MWQRERQMMKPKPIQIPDDIAAKYDQPGQFEAFDQAFKKMIALPPDAVPQKKDIARGCKRKPAKDA